MPDPGVHAYVCDFLEEFHHIEVCKLNDKWIPLSIVATLDWLKIAMWWFFEYTDVERTNEQYERVHNYDGLYEFDPDKLLVFKENLERNAFQERWNQPGLTDEERRDILPFIRSYLENFEAPPTPVVQTVDGEVDLSEIIVWATFMWVLSQYGKDWIYELEELFGCVQDFKAAYVSAWEDSGKLLDPRLMVDTKREVGTCATCGTRQWCVQGYMVQRFNEEMIPLSEAKAKGVSEEDLVNQGWKFYCNRCAVDLKEYGYKMDEYDERIANPMCGNTTCLNTGCPHLPTVEGVGGRKIPKTMVEVGNLRVDRWQDEVTKLGGVTPRQLAGQTAEDIVNHFK
tara:strand:+ start:1192 stop:2211 length:1020 start_codon:yes stop_codon:yes gene_type:complete